MIDDGATLDAASDIDLAGLASSVPGLRAIVVFATDVDLVRARWAQSEFGGASERLARAARDLLRAAYEARAALGAGAPSRCAALLELDSGRLVVEHLGGFGVAYVFDAEAPLGLARLEAHRILEALRPQLEHEAPPMGLSPASSSVDDPPPDSEPPRTLAVSSSAPTAAGHRVRELVATLEQRALEPHLSRARLGLRTGLGRAALDAPDSLSSEALGLVEAEVHELLGSAPTHEGSSSTERST